MADLRQSFRSSLSGSQYTHDDEDVEQDRAMIQQKVLAHSRRRKKKKSNGGGDSDVDDSGHDSYVSAAGEGDDNYGEGSYGQSGDYGDVGDGDYGDDDRQDFLRESIRSHEMDEQVLGGKGEVEGLDALNQALSSPPPAWWAMRKQWQRKKTAHNLSESHRSILDTSTRSHPAQMADDDVDGSNRDLGEEADLLRRTMMLDESGRSGVGGGEGWDDGDGADGGAGTLDRSAYWNHRATAGTSTLSGGGVVPHPVMLTDPRTMGYDSSAFRRTATASGAHPDDSSSKMSVTDRLKGAKGGSKKRTPIAVYMTRAAYRKHKFRHAIYVLAALCAACLFAFFLEQRKLQHYALRASPMGLSAYLAGEDLQIEAGEEEEGDNVEPYNTATEGMKSNAYFIADSERQQPQLSVQKEYLPNFVNENGEAGEGENLQELPPTTVFHREDQLFYLKRTLVQKGITPKTDFNNENSPQYQALRWLVFEDPKQLAGAVAREDSDTQGDGFNHSTHVAAFADHPAFAQLTQRYALAVVYYATGGPGWTEQVNFLSEKDECEWNRETEKGFFIGAGKCTTRGMHKGSITALALWGNELKGFLPGEIGALRSLMTLSLFENEIRGPIPESLKNLSHLNTLYLHNNQFAAGNIEFLCPLKIKDLRTDCGRARLSVCSCCSDCWSHGDRVHTDEVPEAESVPEGEAAPDIGEEETKTRSRVG